MTGGDFLTSKLQLTGAHDVTGEIRSRDVEIERVWAGTVMLRTPGVMIIVTTYTIKS